MCWKSRLQLNDSNHEESYEGTQLGQIKYIVNCTEQTTEGIQATYMELLVRRAWNRCQALLAALGCQALFNNMIIHNESRVNIK